jgi:hypothetical protein
MVDADIWNSANLLIGQHGDKAEMEACQKADLMLALGDIRGSNAWRLIAHAIGELLQEPSGSAGMAG